MLNVTVDERAFLIKNIENAEKLLMSDDVDNILIPLDLYLTINGFDSDDEITNYGREVQRIYDNIYYNN